jgi:autotransporter-associated beta strand protein
MATGQNQSIAALAMGGGAAGSSSTIDIGAGRTLTLGGTVTYSSTNSNLTALITGGAGALLDFGGVVRTFNIGNSTNADPDMRIGANVTLQNGGLIKTGSGTLLIEGTNNLDSLEVQAGAVNGNLGTGNLLLNGGVFESSLTFNRSLGTGNNQVQWAAGANGGFAANGGLFEVAINGGGSLVWDSTPFFVSGAGQLLFGSTTANNVVEFENDIDLNGAVRTVQVVDNTSVTTDRAVLTGVISGGAGSGFTKSGNGVLELRGANLFSGLVTVSGGTLQFSTAANLGNAGANPITLSGGNLNFIGATDVGLAGDVAVTSSSIVSNTGTGELALNGVVTLTNTLTVNGTGEADFAGTVVNSGADRTIVVNNTGGVRFNNLSLTEGTTGRVLIFNVAAGLETNIYGLIANGGSGSSVLRLDGAGTVVVASTATASFTNELRLNNGTLKMQSSKTAQTSTNSIVFSNSAVADSEAILDLDGAGVVYNLGGNILYAANSGITGAASITGTGTLALNATRTFEVRPSANTDTELVISATIANGSAASGVTKSRNGTLVFKGANTYTGTTTISEGILRLDYTGNVDSKIGSTAALTMNGGSLELLGNTTTSVTQSAGTLTVGAGSNRIDVSSNGGPGMILALGGLTSTANGRSMDLVEGDVLASITTTSWAQTNGIFGGWATYNSSQFATADGSGNVQAFASVKNDDVMTWGLNENISDDAGFAGTISGITQINSLLFQSATAESLNVSGELNISSGGILVSAAAGANPTGILGGRLTSSGGALFMHQYNEGASLTISSLLRGALSLTKNGEGELILDSAESSYTGGTFVNKGTLSVTGGNAIGDTSAVTLDAVSGVTFRLLESERIGSLLGGGSDGGLVDLNGQTLTLGNGSSFAGRFTGSGSIVKWGTTNLSLNTSVSSGFTGSVVANQGLVILSSNGVANMGNATLWQVNSGAGLLVDNNGSSTSANRMSDSAAVVFNSANGLSGTAAPYRGLWVRTDQNSTRGETVGAVTYDSGSSYAVFEVSLTGTNTSSIAEFVASTLTRNNFSTLNVRGANLGQGTGAQRGRYRVATAAEAGFMANNMIGGGSLTGTNISIVPWVVGQNLGLNNLSTTVNNQRGNSLATYIAGIGFRPLDFTSDYAIYNDAGVTDNVRMSLAVEEVTGLVGKTVNSLVIDNASNSTAVSLAGSGSLVVTSGAFLFTAVDAANATGAELATPQGIAVGGFADITVGPAVGTVGNEFIMHVMNSAAAGVTITSNLINSTAGNTALTKSGLGTLILTGNNTYSGTTTLNEGVLEIDGWDSIGGASGNATLVFAGGTLRLQAGFTGDFNRTGVIALAQGGGVVDTNGASIAFNTSLTDVAGMSGGITKTGAGTLTLNRAASYTGTTTVLGGVVQAGTNQAIGLGDVVVNGATLDLQTYNASVGRVTLVNSVGSQILGSGTLTSMESVFDLQGGLAEVNLAGTSRLEKTTAGIVELTGANTYTGDTLVSAGVLRAVDGDGLSLASNVEINGGIIASSGTFARALGEDAGELQITGGISGFSAEGGDLTLTLLDNGGSVNWGSPVFNPATLVLNGAGADSLLNWTSGINLNGAARTISVQAGTATLSGLVADGTGSGSLIKTGAGVLAYGAVNSYTGSTSINEGTLKITSDQDLAGALQFGSANNITTAGKLDLSDASATFGSMLVQTNSVGNINEVVIGEGQALTIEGNVTIGTSFGGTTTTNFAASGAGEFIVNNAAANGFFAVGGITTGSGQANRAIADFSDLASMTVNLNTSSGVFRVNPVSTASANVSSRFSTLTLAAETNITANILAIGDGTINNGAVGQVNTLRLGSGMTTINVNTINLGNGTRDSGAVLFDTATGSVKIRGTTGETSRATLNMANTGGGTGAGTDGNVFDVSGHEADLLFGAVTIGTQSRMNAYTNLFAFDQGVLRMTSLAMSGRTAGSTSTGVGLSRDITSTMNLGGGTVTIDNGILSLATLSGSYTGNAAPVITGIINITGGVVNIGATLGVSVNMAGNTASGTPTSGVSTTTAEINITGGTVSMTGNIVKGTVSVANASNASATVTLDGGSLDMNGMAIGTDASRVNFEALSGTLRNLGELNGGGTGTGLLKQGTGLLKVEGVNSFNGGTRIAEGTLELVNSNLRETTVDGTGAVLAGSGTVTSLNLTSGTVSPGALTGDTIGELQVAGNAIFGFSAGAPREIVMEIRGASGMADLSAYDVADIPTMAAELLTRPTGEAYDHDYIEITGTLQWETGATKLVVEDLGVEYAYGMVFNLMDWTAGFTGANLEFPNNPYAGGTANPDFELPDFGTSGLLWDVSLFNDYGVLVVVPEPGRMVLLLAGLTALILRRRRESAATV